MISLENNLNTEKAALDTLRKQVDTAIQKDRDEAARGQPYWEAKTQAGELGGLSQGAGRQN